MKSCPWPCRRWILALFMFFLDLVEEVQSLGQLPGRIWFTQWPQALMLPSHLYELLPIVVLDWQHLVMVSLRAVKPEFTHFENRTSLAPLRNPAGLGFR
jgi:hypothetical protein